MKKRNVNRPSSAASAAKASRLKEKLFLTLFLSFVVFALLYAGGLFSRFGGETASAQKAKSVKVEKPQYSFDKGSLSVSAANQIQALLDEKESRTPAQKKIDSNLLYQLKMNRSEPVAEGVETQETGIDVDDKGGVKVDITAQVTDNFLDRLRDLGGLISESFPQYHTVTAKLPLENLETLAELPDVIFIRPSEKAHVWKNTSPDTNLQTTDAADDFYRTDYSSNILLGGGGQMPGFAERAQRVREFLKSKFTPSSPQTGSAATEGDTTHQANTLRSTYGPNGTGIKIGVLSNGVDTYTARQATGDLPADLVVLNGQRGSGDEGTAMLEIVNDIAPGAKLYFATANGSTLRFGQNIRDLRALGCDIIIDDVFYFSETPFQDGQSPSVVSNTNGGAVIQAVNDVTAAGAMYFSSAGNQGNVDDNTACTYQGDFTDGGASTAPLPLTGNLHNFGGGLLYDPVTTASGNSTNLYWADPLGGSANDYDLFTLNSTGTAVSASSTNVQSGTQDPYEITAAAAVNTRIVVLKKTGAANRFFHITTNCNGAGKLGTVTNGTTKGHSMAVNAYSVAATPAVGPYPAAHSASNVSETFTSDGPRRIFFNADGTPFTPGNFSSTGGILRQKPDITAADGVTTTTPGFIPFYGTSAAAPHAGAMAALIKSANPALTPAQIRTAITATAIDIEAAGVDRDTGAGIFMPIPTLTNLGLATPRAVVDRGASTVTESPTVSDGDGRLEPGERGQLLVQTLQNTGVVNATNVTATLSSTTPGVSIVAPATLPFSDITAGAGSTANTTPYVFYLDPNFACGTPINFTLTVNYTGGGNQSQALNFPVDTTATTTISSTLDATAPTPGANYTTATGTQTNRVSRDGVGNSCTLAEVYPGTVAATNLRYDAYTFTAVSTGCQTVSYAINTTPTSTNFLFSVAYGSGGFVPTNVASNYLADGGASPGAINTPFFYSFNVTAGQQFTVVVHEVTSGGGTGDNYTLTLTGAPSTVCNVATAAGASVTGQVRQSAGRALANARVTLSNSQGFTRTIVTNSFGYFKFDGVTSGETYIINASSKQYRFAPQVISVTDNISGLTLTALP